MGRGTKAAALAAGVVLATPLVGLAAGHPEGGPGAAGRAHPPARLGSAANLPAIAPAPDYSGALWEPASPRNYTVADRPFDLPIQRLVIHVAQGGFAPTYSWFKNPAAEASANYVVGSSGQVAQMVPESDIAWHAGNWAYNETSIGIEHAGWTNVTRFPDAQYRGSARLAGYLARKYQITPDRKHVIGHSEVPDPGHPGQFGGADHHTDPGRTWNWPLYMSYLRMYAADTYQQVVSSAASPGRIAGSGTTFHYRLSIPTAGSYDVFMRWPCASHPAAVTVGAAASGGYRAVRVDERRYCARGWNKVGTFALTAGDSAKLVVLGASTANPIRVVAVTDPLPPTAPQVSLNAGVGEIDASWTASTDNIAVGAYQFWVGSIKEYLGTGRSATATGLACSTTYTVSVRAVDLVSNRSPRQPFTATTAPCPPPPVNLQVSNITQTSVTLSWSSAGGTTDGYDTYLDAVHQAATSTTSYTYTNLKCDTSHAFGVAARDSAGHISATHTHVYARTLPC